MFITGRYGYFKSRELEGTYLGHPGLGTWITTYNRSQYGWGRLPIEKDDELDKYVSNNLNFPAAFDALAKSHRIHHYYRVRNAQECRDLLRSLPNFFQAAKTGKDLDVRKAVDIKAAFEITRQFFKARQGIIADGDRSPVVGTHSVPMLAVNEPQKTIAFWNGFWGLDWGYNGDGQMSYAFFDKHMVEAWYIDERRPEFPAGEGIVTWRREHNDASWGTVHSLEIYDSVMDERIGWSFAVVRDGVLEVDELYVRPQFRRRGFGAQLVGMLQCLAAEKQASIKLWIPFPDAELANREALASIVKRLNLGIHRSGVRWAAYAATTQEPKLIGFPFVRIPEKPATPAAMVNELDQIENLQGSVIKFDDPFGAATSEDDWEACS